MAKVKWVRQRDSYSCGPVSVINVLKWKQYPITYASLPALRKLCKCHPATGTDKEDLEAALRVLGIRFKRTMGPTMKEIDQHLSKGGVVLINYCITVGHYALCVGRSNKTYTMVNAYDDFTLSTLARNEVKYMLEWWLDGQEHWVWFIYPGAVNDTRVNKLLKETK